MLQGNSRGDVCRGHRRSATECCAKAKAMRLQHKKVVAHKNCSGAECMECPYYMELNNKLKSNDTTTLLNIMHSLLL